MMGRNPFKHFISFGLIAAGISAGMAHAQTKIADSLKATLSNVPDTQVVLNCIRISYLNTHLNVDSSLVYGERALALATESGNKRLIAKAKAQLGVHYTSATEFDKGAAYSMEAFNYFDTISDYESASFAANIIGNASAGAENRRQAMQWYRTAGKYGSLAGNEFKVAIALFGLANQEFELNIFDSAAVHFDLCEEIFVRNGRKQEAASCALTRAHIDYKQGRYQESYDRLMSARNDVKACENQYLMAFWFYLRGCCQRELGRTVPALADLETSTIMFKGIKSYTNVQDCYDEIAKTHKMAGDADSAYYYLKLLIRLTDSLNTAANDEKLAEIQSQYDLAEKDKLILQGEAEARESETRQNYFIAGMVLLAILLIGGIWNYRKSQQANRIITEEKKKSDELLLNILPHETAEELKQTGAARARNFDMVTVMFTDFKGFTSMSEKLTAEELVSEINEYFIAFDNIISKHGIEKIKTIGDAYMAVGGLPSPKETHAIDVVNAALDIQEFVVNRKEVRGLRAFEIRIGIHSGPVIAGIVGLKKFAYDIWGDTVNIAARMESSGVNGAINASSATYELVKDKFKCIPRGRIDVKGKGELEMYFIVPEKTERVMDFVRAKDFIIDQLSSGLPPQYYYHSVGHTLDVMKAVDHLVKEENITDSEEAEILRTAAAYHDAGFLRQYSQNEAEASKMAAELLPRFGFSDEQVRTIQRCIMVTVIDGVPADKLERIIKDADFDYLGRDDYWDISLMLRKEWESIGITKTDEEWFASQIDFLTSHEYYTDTAKRERAPMKMAHVEVLKKLLSRLKAKNN